MSIFQSPQECGKKQAWKTDLDQGTGFQVPDFIPTTLLIEMLTFFSGKDTYICTSVSKALIRKNSK